MWNAGVCRAHRCPVGSAPPGTPCGRVADPAPASDGCAILAWAINGVPHYMAAVTFPVVSNTTNALFFVRCDSRRSTPGGEIPQNLPHRHLRRLALAGFSRFCGTLALRTFQCSPLRGSAFQCYAYCSFCLQFTPQRSLSDTNRVQLCNMGDFAEPFPPPLRDLLWPRRSSLGRAPRHSTKSPSPPFEAARPYRLTAGALVDFVETLRSGASVRLRRTHPCANCII